MVPQGINVVVGNYATFTFTPEVFGAIVQFPNADGSVEDYKEFIAKANANETRVAVADLMSLVLLTPPGEWGADVVFGSSQRFGIPMFYGGPSAAFFATKDEYKRAIPGRIIGISKDAYGHPAYRLALQTREQHIKREKATSNICTAQALLATMAGFYAVYHGADGLRNIAGRIHASAGFLAAELEKLGYKQLNKDYFDTMKIELPANVSVNALREIALECKVNLRYFEGGQVGIIQVSTKEPAYGYRRIVVYLRRCCWKDYMLEEAILKRLISIRNCPYFGLPARRCIQEISYGNRVDALHHPPGTQRRIAGSVNDLFGIMYDEAECCF